MKVCAWVLGHMIKMVSTQRTKTTKKTAGISLFSIMCQNLVNKKKQLVSLRNYTFFLVLIFIPPTYEVCGGIYLYPRHTKYVGVYSFRFSVRSFVRTYVRSFVFLSQGQSFCVKVYKTSYFEDPLMDFIHIWHDGRHKSKVFISTIPTLGVTLG